MEKQFFWTITFLCSSIMLSGCDYATKATNQQYSSNDLLINDSLLLKWRMDSFGCAGYRSYAIADSIFKKYNLIHKSISEVKKMLGSPNKEWDNEAYHGLTYFFDTHCTNNKLDTAFDKCWIDILLSKNSRETNSLSIAVCE